MKWKFTCEYGGRWFWGPIGCCWGLAGGVGYLCGYWYCCGGPGGWFVCCWFGVFPGYGDCPRDVLAYIWIKKLKLFIWYWNMLNFEFLD